jgi:hypothetical protein
MIFVVMELRCSAARPCSAFHWCPVASSQSSLHGAVGPDTREVRPDTREVRPDTREVRPDTREVGPDTREVRPDTREGCHYISASQTYLDELLLVSPV